MNFSKTCRDNEVLSNIKFWLNTLASLGVLFGYYIFLYRGYLLILGSASEELEEPSTKHGGWKLGG